MSYPMLGSYGSYVPFMFALNTVTLQLNTAPVHSYSTRSQSYLVSNIV